MIYPIIFSFLLFCEPSYGADLDLVFDALLKGFSQLKREERFNVDDFSDLRKVCMSDDDGSGDNCRRIVDVLIRSIEFINDREPKAKTDYYHFIIAGLIVLKFIIVAIFTFLFKRHFGKRRRNNNRRDSKKRNKSTGDDESASAEEENPGTEMNSRESFVKSVKDATPSRDVADPEPVAANEHVVTLAPVASNEYVLRGVVANLPVRKKFENLNDKIVVRKSVP